MRLLATTAIAFAVVMACAVVALVLPSVAQSSTKYSVYCANGKIEVDMRTPEQMKSARGSDVCQLGEFNYLSDAQSFASITLAASGPSARVAKHYDQMVILQDDPED